MAYEIKILDLIDIDLESSFLVLARNWASHAREDLGLPHPRPGHRADPRRHRCENVEIMQRLGMTGYRHRGDDARGQLAQHGVKMDDVRWILHTHHHIDHAGQDARSRCARP